MSHTNIRRDLDGVPLDFYPDDFMPGWRFSLRIPPAMAVKIRDDIYAAIDKKFMELAESVAEEKS